MKRKTTGETKDDVKQPAEKKSKTVVNICDDPDLFVEYKDTKFGVKLETMKSFSKLELLHGEGKEKPNKGDTFPVTFDMGTTEVLRDFLHAWHNPYMFNR